ncbi:MAG: DUF397 domain-containing protein [Stackebrandtia sp.]
MAEELKWVTAGELCGHPADCIAVAALPGGGVAIRDTKDPGGAEQRYTPEEFGAFVEAAKLGKFDELI